LNATDLVCFFPEPVNIPEEKTLFVVMTGLKAVPEKVLSIKEIERKKTGPRRLYYQKKGRIYLTIYSAFEI
jgi:hypothetical protein